MQLADRFAGLTTPSVSDALDRQGIPGQVAGVRPVAGGAIVGPAFTVRYVPVTGGGGTVGDYIDEVPAGHVVVLDNGGRMEATVWGGLLTRAAIERGVAGTVIHGVCRDTPEIIEASYPLFARGRYMRTGKGRVRVAGMGEAVSMGRVAVEPGDVAFGDADGLLFIPAGRLDETLALAREIERSEGAIVQRLKDGERLDQARDRVDYHRLQEPR